MGPSSERTTLKRGANRAEYDSRVIKDILKTGMIAHVGVVADSGPIVLPMAYGVGDDDLLLHGSVANAMLRAGTSVDVCVTVTLLDGLVVARTPLHNSMNYRSVVVRGTATKITDPTQKASALKIINDHVAPIWDSAREPSPEDFKATLVLSVPLAESSAKVRTGGPIDDPEDVDGPHWAGVVPLETRWGHPTPASDLRPGIEIPSSVDQLSDQLAHPATEE